MSAIFKPEPIKWEDIEGGLGADEIEKISNFVWEYCYSDEPKTYDADEELGTDMIFFAEAWEKIDGSFDTVATVEQTTAVLSLIVGSFFSSWAREKIVEALVKSATKPQLVEILTNVTSAYCQYISLRARVEIEEMRKRAGL